MVKSEWKVSSFFGLEGEIFEVYRVVEGNRNYMPWYFDSYRKAKAVADHMNVKELGSCELTNSQGE